MNSRWQFGVSDARRPVSKDTQVHHWWKMKVRRRRDVHWHGALCQRSFVDNVRLAVDCYCLDDFMCKWVLTVHDFIPEFFKSTNLSLFLFKYIKYFHICLIADQSRIYLIPGLWVSGDFSSELLFFIYQRWLSVITTGICPQLKNKYHHQKFFVLSVEWGKRLSGVFFWRKIFLMRLFRHLKAH